MYKTPIKLTLFFIWIINPFILSDQGRQTTVFEELEIWEGQGTRDRQRIVYVSKSIT